MLRRRPEPDIVPDDRNPEPDIVPDDRRPGPDIVPDDRRLTKTSRSALTFHRIRKRAEKGLF